LVEANLHSEFPLYREVLRINCAHWN